MRSYNKIIASEFYDEANNPNDLFRALNEFIEDNYRHSFSVIESNYKNKITYIKEDTRSKYSLEVLPGRESTVRLTQYDRIQKDMYEYSYNATFRLNHISIAIALVSGIVSIFGE